MKNKPNYNKYFSNSGKKKSISEINKNDLDDSAIRNKMLYSTSDYGVNKNYIKKMEIVKNEIFINPFFEKERTDYINFLSLIKFDGNLSDPIIRKERKDIYNHMFENSGRNMPYIDYFYFNCDFRFGNQLSVLNKLIFYSEILGVKKIILNEGNNLYIKNNIFDKEYNLTIEVNTNNNNAIDLQNNDFINLIPEFYYKVFNLRIENRFSVFKDEILNNLPKLSINSKDLYIHIRGGDIFSEQARNPDHAPGYAPYPLCFYKEVINNNNYNKIYIISEDKSNPVIDKLLNLYSNVIYNENSLEVDISYLAHAYNIIGSISSFVISIIKLNDNLKYYWEYDIYHIEHKLYHLHQSIFDYPRNYTILRMYPSEQYQKRMYQWIRSEEQIEIMMNDNCPNEFRVII